MGIEEGEKVQRKSIGNSFNKTVAENFPNFNKRRVIQELEAFRTPNKQYQKRTSTGLI
jgi:hypothetical protein